MNSLNALTEQHKKVTAAANNARNATMLTAKHAATKLADEVAVLLETKIQCLYEINDRLNKLEGVSL
ncbi:hypothetical protein [Pseudoalteromonas sp. 68 DY56-GL68]|uniref:hypothetical protein n=1 Tax=Pseudoalteromonas sp. 68 DY56-GL68 TaxID=2974919 RepID=UPI00352AA8AD